MPVRVPKSPVRSGLTIALLAGTLSLSGCARYGGPAVFRRFWGFEEAPVHAVAGQDLESRVTAMLPKFWSGHTSDDEWTEDPFLNPAEPYADFAAMPDQSAPADFRGDAVQLVQHQAAVHDISSPDRSVPDSPPPNPTGPSQLERLKTALRHDATIGLAPQNPMQETKAARGRVVAMMKTARRQMQLGEYDSALRWAIAAEQLAGGSELFFGPDEDQPGDLVRNLQDRLKLPYAPPPAPPLATESPPPQAPALRIEFPKSPPAETQPPAELLPRIEGAQGSQAHATHAMKEAVIAPETLTPGSETAPAANSAGIARGQRHRRSLKVDARRVSANQGAMVSAEGQLNPPVETPLPDLPLAPPAAEESPLPPVDIAMTDPSLLTRPAPQLPPPNSVETPRFLYADTANMESAREPVKNVHWDETPLPKPQESSSGWMFPVIVLAGALLLALFTWRRLRV